MGLQLVCRRHGEDAENYGNGRERQDHPVGGAHRLDAGDGVKIHLISGLPRSGSTLLCNILAQNPRFHATATSGILEILFQVRNHWGSVAEFQAMPEAQSVAAKQRVLVAVLQAYFGDVDRPVIFDKSRGWLAHLEMAEALLGYKPRVLVPVRDLRDVLASFERLYRATSALAQTPDEAANYMGYQTLEARLAGWAGANGPVGLAYNRIKDALARGWDKQMLFVPYEALTSRPGVVMSQIYSFLDEAQYAHDFEHVAQATTEDDRIYGFSGLHTIRQQVRPQKPQWPEVLGDHADKYAGLDFWSAPSGPQGRVLRGD